MDRETENRLHVGGVIKDLDEKVKRLTADKDRANALNQVLQDQIDRLVGGIVRVRERAYGLGDYEYSRLLDELLKERE